MAKVRINGDTSGYIELASPAAAGSNTITLPSSNGSANQLLKNSGTAGTLAWSTLTEDSSGNLNIDSGTLYVDASNNRVGIGSTAPNYELQINASDAVSVIQLTNTSTGATASDGLLIYNNGVNAFISNEESGFLKFQTAGAERAQIDASGRLLVGTSSAGSSLTRTIEIHGTGGGPTDQPCFENYAFTGTTADRSGYLQFYRSRGTSVGTNTIVASGDQLGVINFRGANGSSYDIAAQIKSEVDGTPAASNDMPGRLVFSVTRDNAASPTESMRIKNNGETWILPTLYGLEVSTATGAGTTYTLYEGLHSGGSVGAGTLSYRVFSNGNVQNTNGSFTAISDVRLKENIVDANSQWNDLKAIQIRNWNFKEETGYETHRQIGPIAQELEEVCPGLVFETPDRDEDGNETGEVTKGVNQSVLYMKAVKALQEAQLRIEQLETLNASFEARLAALEVKP